jgi:hypothetical protein
MALRGRTLRNESEITHAIIIAAYRLVEGEGYSWVARGAWKGGHPAAVRLPGEGKNAAKRWGRVRVC